MANKQLSSFINPSLLVINDDCRNVLPSIIKEVANPIIVTDPPFNVGYHYDEYEDNMEEDEYYEMLSSLFSMCPCVVIHYPESLYKLSFKMGVFPSRVVSWVYNSNTPRQHRDIAYFGVTPCFDGLGEYKNPTDKRIAKRIAEGKKAKGYDWIYADQVKNVSKGADGHPCQMPLSVMQHVVGSLPQDATIIDPFSGGGTTLLAAKRLGRQYRGIELSPKYYKDIINRLSNDTPLFDMVGLEEGTKSHE